MRIATPSTWQLLCIFSAGGPAVTSALGFEGQDLVDMARTGTENPLRFMVDSQRNGMIQTILYVLVSTALFGIALETCFIYHLYTTKQSSELLHDKNFTQTDARKDTFSFCIMEASTVPPKKTRPPPFKALKPLAHLGAGSERPGADGVMPWNDTGESELHELEYKENKLVVKKEGYYYIYSKLCFDADEDLFNHFMLRTSHRYFGHSIHLLRYAYRGNNSKTLKKEGFIQNSYLGGVFHLIKGDAVFVVVKNGTVHLFSLADNYFGMFMV
ncbi:tumor necrosis factor ligand superfamily member 14-like [Colossoma macropomum]|uniref:tumor necrosis factor ligand superfamily member 14-like n=1 Tax=Colossoma macropomum TaxID=42526 RepID=UPI001864F440|nr:tumor necrosis factor ligand superfamily member 14-like [Colossoma macropomum]